MTGEADNDKRQARPANLDWDADAPRSIFFDDIYFSGDGAAESAHVFLNGNDLAARFESADQFTIGELGFGTGLNFLLASDLWRRTKRRAGARLFFMSVEGFPLSAGDLARAQGAWPHLSALSQELRERLPPPAAGVHRIEFSDNVTLLLHYGDVAERLARAEARIDVWFFDGFSPAKNPAMWAPEIFEEAARLSAPGATFATFTVAGHVRRAAEGAGFEIEKRPGFGRKKEMLAGRIESPPRQSRRASWFQNENATRLRAGARLAIIGGGIAGASLAHEAAKAGLTATIFDKQGLAAGASGNPAALIMPRLDLGDGPPARFFRAAFFHTIRLLSDAPSGSFNPCGVLLHAGDEEERARQQKLLEKETLPAGWMEARADCLFFPQAGVANPPALIQWLARAASLIRGRVRRIDEDGDGAALVLEDGAIETFDAVVIANGADALSFNAARALPLEKVAGQLDWFKNAAAPDHAIAFGPYAAPAPPSGETGGGLVIGATYEKTLSLEPSLSATRANIKAIAAVAPALAASLDPATSVSRKSFRCQTPDRLPVVGAAPDLAHFASAYDDLRLGVHKDYPAGRSIPGVFILTGLGSRGFVTAPLAAAMLVAEMTGAPAPVDGDVAEALHSARFFIRDYRRGRTIRKG